MFTGYARNILSLVVTSQPYLDLRHRQSTLNMITTIAKLRNEMIWNCAKGNDHVLNNKELLQVSTLSSIKHNQYADLHKQTISICREAVE